MKAKIGLITLGVADMKTSLAFYRDGLGFPAHNYKEGDDAIFFKLEGSWLSLYPREKLAADAQIPAGRKGFPASPWRIMWPQNRRLMRCSRRPSWPGQSPSNPRKTQAGADIPGVSPTRTAISGKSRGTRSSISARVRKRFFFEKKNQKTSASGGGAAVNAHGPGSEVFCFFLFQKEDLRTRTYGRTRTRRRHHPRHGSRTAGRWYRGSAHSRARPPRRCSPKNAPGRTIAEPEHAI